MFSVYEELKHLQQELKKLNNQEYSDLSNRVQTVQQQLTIVQKDVGLNPSNPFNQIKERDLCKQYLSLVRAEESFAQQKSSIQWLKLGWSV